MVKLKLYIGLWIATMSENICCPECGARLMYGLRELVSHTKVIDPKTGKLHKRTSKKRLMNCDTRRWIICENIDCYFYIDDEDQMYERYFHLFKMVDDADIEVFSREIQPRY